MTPNEARSRAYFAAQRASRCRRIRREIRDELKRLVTLAASLEPEDRWVMTRLQAIQERLS